MTLFNTDVQVADSKHKQIRKLQAHHQDQVREMEGRLMQEEDTAVGLREEIKNKEVDIAKMRKTLKDVSRLSHMTLMKTAFAWNSLTYASVVCCTWWLYLGNLACDVLPRFQVVHRL